MSNFKEDLRDIKAFIFDIDGVLSTQTITLDKGGHPLRSINLRDGYALQLAVKNGYRIAVISGGNSESYRKRLKSLGISNVNLNSSNKLKVFDEYLDGKN